MAALNSEVATGLRMNSAEICIVVSQAISPTHAYNPNKLPLLDGCKLCFEFKIIPPGSEQGSAASGIVFADQTRAPGSGCSHGYFDARSLLRVGPRRVETGVYVVWCALRKEWICRTASGIRSLGSFQGKMLTSDFGASITHSMATE